MIYDSEYALTTIKQDKPLLYLAGSIDLQLEGDWRKYVAGQLGDDFHYFDPTTLKHDILSESEWEAHIIWELKAMEMADVILMNFLPNAQSPISLVELGLNTFSGKLIVVCPEEFYKNQYVKTLC